MKGNQLVLFFVASCSSGGCAGPARGGERSAGLRPGSDAIARGGALVEQRVKGSPALWYGDRAPVALDAFQTTLVAILGRVARDLRRGPLSVDGATVGAATEICRGLPAIGPPAANLVDFALRSHGLVEPAPHLVVADVPAGTENVVADQAGKRLRRLFESGDYARAGVAVCRPLQTPDRRRVVIALLESHLTIGPLPRALRRGETAALRARFSGNHRDPNVVMMDPRGTVVPLAYGLANNGMLTARLPCERPGVYRIEVTGVGAHGIEVLANFPLYCAQAPPKSVAYASTREALHAPARMEARLVALTNRFRERSGLSPLAASDTLARVARAHSRDMLHAGFIGHLSPTTGSPADRLRRAGISYLVVRENVARAYSTEEVMSELGNSPAHRANLLSRDVSEIGIGVTIDDRSDPPALLVTQNFLQRASALDPAAARARLLTLIAERRRSLGLPALQERAPLAQRARGYLETYRTRGRAAAEAELQDALRAPGVGLDRVGGVFAKVSAIESMSVPRELLLPGLTEIGFAVLRAEEELWFFALFGSSR